MTAIGELHVRRSILISASPEEVWEHFSSLDRMGHWWGRVIGSTKAGTSQGMHLRRYEPRVGGRVETHVSLDGERASFGGPIVTFVPNRELTIENDWIPNRGWQSPTYFTIKLSPMLGGTLVELFHHGFERIGGDVASEHAGYEQGWGMTQLSALKERVEVRRPSN